MTTVKAELPKTVARLLDLENNQQDIKPMTGEIARSQLVILLGMVGARIIPLVHAEGVDPMSAEDEEHVVNLLGQGLRLALRVRLNEQEAEETQLANHWQDNEQLSKEKLDAYLPEHPGVKKTVPRVFNRLLNYVIESPARGLPVSYLILSMRLLNRLGLDGGPEQIIKAYLVAFLDHVYSQADQESIGPAPEPEQHQETQRPDIPMRTPVPKPLRPKKVKYDKDKYKDPVGVQVLADGLHSGPINQDK